MPDGRAARSRFGWWRRVARFPRAGLRPGALGAVATAIYLPLPALSLAIGARVFYAFVQCTLCSGEDRFGELERDAVRVAAAAVTIAGPRRSGLATRPRRLAGGRVARAGAWIVLEAGLLDQPAEFRRFACCSPCSAPAARSAFDFDSRLALVDAALALRLRRPRAPRTERPRPRCRHLPRHTVC